MPLSSDDVQRLVHLVATYAGLRLSDRDLNVLETVVTRRLQELKLGAAQSYIDLLAAQRVALDTPMGQTITREAEWSQLLTQLTIGESYFFRDQQQFHLLRTRLLPERIQALAPVPSSAIQLWSAGCATGEEVYSLAMLWQELGSNILLPPVTILGTDINTVFLSKAQQGTYGSWSFRQTSPLVQQTYFQASGSDRWQIRPEVQQRVNFELFNLAIDPVSRLTQRWGTFDVIICRNVFIYFTPAAIAATLRKFYDALKPGGYLITGHAELQSIDLSAFRVQRYPESLVYQRPPHATSPPPPISILPARSFQLPVTPRSVPAVVNPAPQISPSPIRHRTRSTPAAAISSAAASPSPVSEVATERLAVVQALANKGDYAVAYTQALQLVQQYPLDPTPCYVLANIAEVQDDIEDAKRWLKRIIYLDPNAVLAHVELAALYDRSGDQPRAQKIRQSLLRVLQTLPADQLIPIDAGLTVAELRSALAALQ